MAPLLDHMGQLMGQQFAAGVGLRSELARGEVDVAADGEGTGIQFLAELGGLVVGMDDDMGEVLAELLFHVP
ncbi:hypothetical protein BOX17_01455 [Halomonas aestuarii]|uniref:Uncharacterized protein n=1 Tax=Halomonas aestuarii TaxID=1897729 RepID=A0A1J0VCI5_9GAMM|nr:hypothetical protein BOX17_01455 [Halomonas aestuarii]